jgi:hypothetical protein
MGFQLDDALTKLGAAGFKAGGRESGSEPMHTERESRPAAAGPTQEWSRCPACGLPQRAQSDECRDCGIIISKYAPPLAQAPTREYPVCQDGKPLPNGLAAYVSPINIVCIILGLLGIYLFGTVVNRYFPEGDGPVTFLQACSDGDIDRVRELLDNGMPANVKDQFGTNGVGRASFHGHPEIVKLLIGRGAALNSDNNLGMTPLMLACKAGRLEVVHVLVENGAGVNDVNRVSGLAVLSYAQDPEIHAFLKEYGAES